MRYRFGDYCLDTQRYELHRGRVPIPLQPKVYQVLAYLLTHADRWCSSRNCSSMCGQASLWGMRRSIATS
jgi:DNA-binding response OmpR family regulator